MSQPGLMLLILALPPLIALGVVAARARPNLREGITVIGGLLVSTFLTLVVIPVVYSLMDRRA